MKKQRWYIFAVAALGLVIAFFLYGGWLDSTRMPNLVRIVYPVPKCEVAQLVSAQDQNQNGVPDSIDIVAGARQEVTTGTVYDGSYFQNGYPPEGQGACTDVVWRAFKNAGYDLKALVDQDIKNAPRSYGATGRKPDPNIDFRRVANLQVYFGRHAQALTTEIIPGDAANLYNWQPGDIVVFGLPLEHIAIISDQRGRDGVPYMIHNCGPKASEDNFYLLNWPSQITYHFRFIPL